MVDRIGSFYPMRRGGPKKRRLTPASDPVALLVCVAVILGLVSGAALRAQKGKEGRNRSADVVDETFEGFSQVIEVQIPINVSTRDGETVRDLTRDDFTILDKGVEQPITRFEVIDLDLLEPGQSRTEIERAVPSAARRHFLLLFDLSFSNPTALVRAREAARDFVMNSLHPTDLAAVATHAVGVGVNLVITFTPDRVQLARAIDTLGAARFLQLAETRDPLRFVIDPLGDGNSASSDVGGADVSRALSGRDAELQSYFQVVGKQMQRMERSFMRGRIADWTRSMKELGRLLDSVKGRKHVVLFSEGFDGRLLLGRQPDADDAETMADLFNIQFGNYFMVDTDDMYGSTPLQNDMGSMLEEFRRADAIIQTVDISGLSADTAAKKRVRSVSETALFYIANETGGELYEDANNFGRHLDKVLSRSTVTYLVTIQPKDLVADGSYHELKVKVDAGKGVRVAARKGYYAPRQFQDLHPLERDLLASDAIASATAADDIETNVLVAAFRASEERAYVPVIIEVDGPSLLVGVPEDEESLDIEFYTYVTNERGEMRDFFTQLVSIDLRRARRSLERTGLKYYGHVDLEPGKHLIRLLTRNALTGRSGVRAVPLDIQPFDGTETALLPPFFLETPGQWVMVREKNAGDEYQSSVIYPFTVNGEPYVPAARPALDSRRQADLCLVAYNLTDAELSLEGSVLSESGQILSDGGVDLVERTVTGISGVDKLLARFDPSGLSEGDYRLRVALTDSGTGRTQTSSIPFKVKN